MLLFSIYLTQRWPNATGAEEGKRLNIIVSSLNYAQQQRPVQFPPSWLLGYPLQTYIQ